jgi:cyclic pyranopterin phosphate synthase
MKTLSHTDEKGRARMVDISEKDVVLRIARATGFITLSAEALQLVKDNAIKKGDVLTVAEIAGVQAAKSTWSLIPLTHNISLNRITVVASIENDGISVSCEVSCTGRTGAEMEALTAVSIALLTVYDMCKAADRSMEIKGIKLVEKSKAVIIA